MLTIVVFLEFRIRVTFRPSEGTKFKAYTYSEIDEEVAKGRLLFVFEYTVVDMTMFMSKHPGRNMLDQYVGTEIGRYIYGGFPCGSGQRYFHSSSALDIIERLKCGYVEPSFSLTFGGKNDKAMETIFKLEEPSFPVTVDVKNDINMNIIWKLESREKASSVHMIMRFSCDSKKATAIVPGINFCGTHISVLGYCFTFIDLLKKIGTNQKLFAVFYE